MRKFFILISMACLAACENNSVNNTQVKDTSSSGEKKDNSVAKEKLTIDAIDYPGNVAYAVFQQDGKTLFYYNVDTKKGSISINKQQYNFDSYQHKINEPDYELKSGDKLTILVTGTKYHEYENPEPGILKGKAANVTVILAQDTLVLSDKVDVIDGTNAD